LNLSSRNPSSCSAGLEAIECLEDPDRSMRFFECRCGEVRLCSLEREGEAKEPQVTSQLSLSKKRELLATEGRILLLFFHPSIVLTNSSDDNSNRGLAYLLIQPISFLRLFFPSSKIESRTSSRGPGGGRSRIEGRDTENEVTHSPRTLNLVL